MKQKKIPTIIGIILLAFSIIAGVTLIKSTAIFKISADVEAQPKNIRVSNITDTSVTITWTTEIKSKGFVKWGSSKNTINKVALEEIDKESYIHSTTIITNKANESVYYTINSNSKDYDNSNIPWETKTASQKVNNSSSITLSGQILETDGATPADAIVYFTIGGNILSAITSSQGNYIVPISNYISEIDQETLVEISVQSGNSISQAATYLKNKSVPVIILGRSYDFRNNNETPTSTIVPESSLNLPTTQTDKSSRFDKSTSEKSSTNSDSTLTIESIRNGEIINTNLPEFFGSGPNGSNIEITVESDPQTESIVVDNTGKWSWSPKKELELGEHNLTIKWKDQSGILREIKRTFVVSAAEGPAFEATPSATPVTQNLSSPSATASTRPSTTPKSTLVSTYSPIATNQPVPETGSLTPTIGLFIMGIGMLSLSIFVFKNQNA